MIGWKIQKRKLNGNGKTLHYFVKRCSTHATRRAFCISLRAELEAALQFRGMGIVHQC
jgi:hypothetical protein